jgi:hypothetical protein
MNKVASHLTQIMKLQEKIAQSNNLFETILSENRQIKQDKEQYEKKYKLLEDEKEILNKHVKNDIREINE